MFLVAELRYTTKINQFAMLFSGWATINDSDQRIRNVFFSGWAIIYDPDQPICNICFGWGTTQTTNFLRFVSDWATTQTNQYAMFLSVAELRSTTQVNQFTVIC